MGDIAILEAAHHMSHRIHLADMLQELVAQALALAGPLHQSGNVHEADRGGSGLLGVIHLMEDIQPAIRHRHHAYIRLDGAERIVGSFGASLGNSVKQRGLAYVRQAHNTYF